MSIGRKCWDSFLKMIGLCAIIFIVVSLIFQNEQVKYFYLMLASVMPVHLFAFFTFALRLFSRHLWVRRFIVIGFGMLTFIVDYFVFRGIQPSREFLIYLGILLVVYVLLTVLIYYVSDKIEKRYLDIINQRLADENAQDGK